MDYEVLREVAEAHVERLLDNMDTYELEQLARHYLLMSFDQNPGAEDTDQELLLSDIRRVEGGDEDSVYEFLVGCGVDEDEATDLAYQ